MKAKKKSQTRRGPNGLRLAIRIGPPLAATLKAKAARESNGVASVVRRLVTAALAAEENAVEREVSHVA